jgi:hypothetical protein
MRGTLSARAIVAKESKASELATSARAQWGVGELTHSSHNLSLHAVLVLESSCKIHDASFSVAGNVGYFADVVVHVPGSKE